MIRKHGVKIDELFFVMQGSFGLYTKYAFRDLRYSLPPFCMMRRHTTYGDYQILFDLYPNMDLKTVPSANIKNAEVEAYMQHSDDLDQDEYHVMVLHAEILRNLCYLYPRTCKSLKYRAIDRRNFFMKAM